MDNYISKKKVVILATGGTIAADNLSPQKQLYYWGLR